MLETTVKEAAKIEGITEEKFKDEKGWTSFGEKMFKVNGYVYRRGSTNFFWKPMNTGLWNTDLPTLIVTDL